MELKEEKSKMLSLLAKVSGKKTFERKKSFEMEPVQKKLSRKIGKSKNLNIFGNIRF